VSSADSADSAAPAGPLVCSARGCSATATWSLLWNNPRLHTPDRRKTWLACGEHRDTLGGFLTARDFLREVKPLVPDVDAEDEWSAQTGKKS
jgi:hypothetical protein